MATSINPRLRASTIDTRTCQRILALVLFVGAPGAAYAQGADPLVVTPVLTTTPLFNYDDAPATPDADDPAIWQSPGNPRHSLIIGTAKDAGLLVYDLSGQLLQAVRPFNTPHLLPQDPPTPGLPNPPSDRPCSDSQGLETFGRFNNVDIAYNVRLGSGPPAPRVDLAVVSDRGCDRVRFYRIDPADPDGPLVDVTADDVPRVFPLRYEQPSARQPSGAVEGWRDNPVDDQNTVYGLTVSQSDPYTVFVSQRERGLVRQLRIVPTSDGHVTYSVERTFLFRTTFQLSDEEGNPYSWTPCREAALEEPQSEGLVFDAANDALYVAFETIGLFRLPVTAATPSFLEVVGDRLIEPVKAFGRPYRAIPDDDEFECEYDGVAEPGDVEAAGSDANAGQFLEADLEGLSIISSSRGSTLLLASSQGDNSFHFYEMNRAGIAHRGVFFVEGAGDTDGVHYVRTPLGREFPMGLLVVQNGEAPEPEDTSDINGYEFDGSTQFMYVNFADALQALSH